MTEDEISLRDYPVKVISGRSDLWKSDLWKE